jgi:hypothetical protein
MLVEETSTVPVSNKVYVVVLSVSHSKMYFSESAYFFCQHSVYKNFQPHNGKW